MNIYISETAYLHYLTNEIEKSIFWGQTLGLTYYPTLIQESRLGYDAMLDKKGKPLFLQSKIPEYLLRKDSKEWWYYKKPYYRFDIYPANKSRQHNLLIDLGNKFKNSVFYVGPLFYSAQLFNIYVSNRKLIENSKFISTTKLKTNFGDDKHIICYSRLCKSKMWSEEYTIENSFDGSLFHEELSKIQNIDYNQFLGMIKSSIWDFYPESKNSDESLFSILARIGIVAFFIIK